MGKLRNHCGGSSFPWEKCLVVSSVSEAFAMDGIKSERAIEESFFKFKNKRLIAEQPLSRSKNYTLVRFQFSNQSNNIVAINSDDNVADTTPILIAAAKFQI